MKRVIKSVLIVSVLAAALNFTELNVSADFEKTENGYVYLNEDGSYATGFQTIGDKIYYFQKDGIMKTGWIKTASGNKYYFKKNGQMATGRLKINGVIYDFGTDGVLKANEEGSFITPGEFHVVLQFWNSDEDVTLYLDNNKIISLNRNDEEKYVDLFVSKGFHKLKAVTKDDIYNGSFYVSTELIKESKESMGYYLLQSGIDYNSKQLTGLTGGHGLDAWFDDEFDKIKKTTHDICVGSSSASLSVYPEKFGEPIKYKFNPVDGSSKKISDKFKGTWYSKTIDGIAAVEITDYCLYTYSSYVSMPCYFSVVSEDENTVEVNVYAQKGGVLLSECKFTLSDDGRKMTISTTYKTYGNITSKMVCYRDKKSLK